MPIWKLGQVDAFRAISQHMHRANSSHEMKYFLVATVAIVLLWLGLQWFNRWQRDQRLRAQTPRALFYELCRAHNLSRMERNLLAQAVADAPPAEMCLVFIDPRILGRLSIDNTPEADSYARLAKKLLGDGLG